MAWRAGPRATMKPAIRTATTTTMAPTGRWPIRRAGTLSDSTDTSQFFVKVLQARNDDLPIVTLAHQLPCCPGERLAQGRTRQRRDDLPRKLARAIGSQVVRSGLGIDTGHAQGGRNDRDAHRHRLKHFQPHATSHAHRDDQKVRPIEPGPLVGDCADDLDARDTGKEPMLGAEIPPDHQEARPWQRGPHRRPDLGAEPVDRVDVRSIIHLADEQNGHSIGLSISRDVMSGIYSIRYNARANRRIQGTERDLVSFRHENHAVSRLTCILLISPEATCLDERI